MRSPSKSKVAFLSPRKPYLWIFSVLAVIAIILASVLGSVLPQQHSHTMTATESNSTQRPKAVVYRGAAASDNCPEAVAALLESSPYKFQVQYADALQANTLDGVSVYAFPGGPGGYSDLPCPFCYAVFLARTLGVYDPTSGECED